MFGNNFIKIIHKQDFDFYSTHQAYSGKKRMGYAGTMYRHQGKDFSPFNKRT